MQWHLIPTEGQLEKKSLPHSKPSCWPFFLAMCPLETLRAHGIHAHVTNGELRFTDIRSESQNCKIF